MTNNESKWVVVCAHCGKPLQTEITPDKICKVEVVCSHCGWTFPIEEVNTPLFHQEGSPYDDMEFIWTTPEKYRHSKTVELICVMQPDHAAHVVKDWMVAHKPEDLGKFSFAKALDQAVGYKTYVLQQAKLPVQYMMPEQAKEEYPEYFEGRL